MRYRRARSSPFAGILFLLVAIAVAACASGASAPTLSKVGSAVDGQAAPPAGASARPQTGGSAGGPGSNGAPLVDDAKIVRTGTLQLQVGKVDEVLVRARGAIRGLGGYISASEQKNDGERSVATVTYRIPSDRWDDALQALRGLAMKVLDEHTESVEVTGALIDLGARIDNLKSSEKALQAIAAQATKISDVLDVQARLTEVRGQIEQLSAQQNHLEDQAGLGTLTVTYGLVVAAVNEAAKNWDAADEVDRASASLVDLLQGLATAGIWFGIVWIPILIGLSLIALLASFVARRMGLLRRGMPQPPLPPGPPSPPLGAEG